jgi:N-acetylornithine carbamoyltransferase
MPQHFLRTSDFQRSELQAMLDQARAFKQQPIHKTLQDKTVALVFFNPSLRTRTSFEVGIIQLGGQSVVLSPGKDAWPLEFIDGAVMDGEAEEHVKEVAKVLSRYCDAIAVRAFPKFQDWQVDRQDQVIKSFAKYSDVPIINMETIVHPCQELALMMMLQNKLGTTDGKKFVLTWTYHPRPLNTAVANSALMIASQFGMDVTLLCPSEEYILDPMFIDQAKSNCQANGQGLTISHDIDSAYADADVVYAKSWGAIPLIGRPEDEAALRAPYKHFIVDEEKMARTNNAIFSHCLPLRRNVKATDGVMDAPYCAAIDEAENRLHVQKAILSHLLG